MISIYLYLPLKPQVKQRPRLGRGGTTYTPKATRTFQQQVKSMSSHLDPLDGALSMEVLFVYPRLKSTPKSKPSRRLKSSRPDLDNLIKAVTDGLQGTAFHDDGQIAQVTALKLYAGIDEEAHIEVSIDMLNETIKSNGGREARAPAPDLVDLGEDRTPRTETAEKSRSPAHEENPRPEGKNRPSRIASNGRLSGDPTSIIPKNTSPSERLERSELNRRAHQRAQAERDRAAKLDRERRRVENRERFEAERIKLERVKSEALRQREEARRAERDRNLYSGLPSYAKKWGDR